MEVEDNIDRERMEKIAFDVYEPPVEKENPYDDPEFDHQQTEMEAMRRNGDI